MDVGLALRNCSKGKLEYDRFWMEEGRTKEVLDKISKYSSGISVTINPAIFPFIVSECETLTIDFKNDVCSPCITPSETKAKLKQAPDPSDAYFFELQSEMELPIQEYEEERLKYIQDVFENKKNEFDKYSMEVQEQVEQEYLLAKRKNELDSRRRTGELRKLEDSLIKKAEELEKVQTEQYQSHVKKLSAKILEAELKQKQAEEELKKRLQEQEEFKVQLKTCLQEANVIVSKSVEKLDSCEHQEYLSISREGRIKQMANLLQYINCLVVQAETRELSIDDILSANLHVQKACEILQDISLDIESAKNKASQALEILHRSFSLQESTNSQKRNSIDLLKSPVSSNSRELNNQDQDIELLEKTNSILDKESEEDEKKIVSLFIAPDAVKHYQMIIDNFKHASIIVQSVRNDSKNKKYRFELQKAINVPINSLSSNSGSQIKVKINRLLSILMGQAPETSGRNMGNDSVIFNFCADLIAKQFVEQGDTQISSQHSTAFPIAFAALGVWLKQPKVGQILLGHFYNKCPYLVPFYPPKEENQTNTEYLQSVGYKVETDGTVEPKYKFLNRISGYVRLYAAIVQSPLPPNIKSSHPHGIEWGWKWLSRMLNLDPRPDITPTLLYDFLDVAGYALQNAYGKQFNKLLHILCKDYFPRIKQVTPGGSGGPLERLEIFLQQSAKKGRISKPDGVLDANFWIR